ncbi:family 78 glycoside hydrolase catalytic domain [Paenarthrobacter nitroguajacolicus]|uniref:family 78 glycoside hydrolase catalytic domain n=1 Tax=Paenarthrobacter nitroguajacolicus TaxID=211146 RepID=UPI001FCC46B0|nr:family 78 glycoside hydrolase catalytic domain [Paenarthrobacter nitroguajacolicus]
MTTATVPSRDSAWPDHPSEEAQFIATDVVSDAAPLFRRTVRLATSHGPVERATLKLSALGVCEAFLNGHEVSDELLIPGWTSYEWRLRYRELDVTDMVTDTLTVAIILGNGWYRGRLGWGEGAAPYGDELAAYAELKVLYSDGYEEAFVTDASWKSHDGPVTANDLYDGQSIDARRNATDWMYPEYDDREWAGVHILEVDQRILTPYIGPPIRRQEEITPRSVTSSPSGSTIVDFGQNLVGWVRVKVSGPEGSIVTLRHSEVLEAGEVCVRPLRTAHATDHFTLSGGDDVFEPTFTFHGFRYVEVTGLPENVDVAADGTFTAVVVGSDLSRTGTFRCSNPLLNRLHDNIVWSMRGNFVDVPTDCPQRDERLGWTGDLSVFAPTAAYLYDVKDFLRDWLQDLSIEQAHQGGIVPVVIPDVLKRMTTAGLPPVDSTAIWGDAAVWVPWALWSAYGDPVVLEESFDSMAAHVRRVRSLLAPSGLWDGSLQFGDWLDPDSDPAQPWAAKADPGVVATASAYRSAIITSQTAQILHRSSEYDEFADMALRLREAFRENYVQNQRIHSDCTTAYSLAIMFGILEPDELSWAGQRLAELVDQSGYKISTGFAGTPFINDALTLTGHTNTAYQLLLQQHCPSWLYPVTMGATTVWERWDSMLPDGSVNPGEMTSFNHYALGAVADWMHRIVGGITPLEPGYRRILFSPQPGGELTWAESELTTPHGKAKIRWAKTPGGFEVDLTVPTGTTAILRLPGRSDIELQPGTHSINSKTAESPALEMATGSVPGASS